MIHKKPEIDNEDENKNDKTNNKLLDNYYSNSPISNLNKETNNDLNSPLETPNNNSNNSRKLLNNFNAKAALSNIESTKKHLILYQTLMDNSQIKSTKKDFSAKMLNNEKLLSKFKEKTYLNTSINKERIGENNKEILNDIYKNIDSLEKDNKKSSIKIKVIKEISNSENNDSYINSSNLSSDSKNSNHEHDDNQINTIKKDNKSNKSPNKDNKNNIKIEIIPPRKDINCPSPNSVLADKSNKELKKINKSPINIKNNNYHTQILQKMSTLDLCKNKKITKTRVPCNHLSMNEGDVFKSLKKNNTLNNNDTMVYFNKNRISPKKDRKISSSKFKNKFKCNKTVLYKNNLNEKTNGNFLEQLRQFEQFQNNFPSLNYKDNKEPLVNNSFSSLSKSKKTLDIIHKTLSIRKGDANTEMMKDKLNILEKLKNINYNKNSKFGILSKKIEISNIVLSIISIFSVIFSLTDYEIFIKKSEKYLNKCIIEYNLTEFNLELFNLLNFRFLSTEEICIKVINCIISIIGCFLIVYKYLLLLSKEKLDKNLSKYDDIITSKLYKLIIRDCLICLIHPFPYVNKVYPRLHHDTLYIYSLTGIFASLSLIKLIFILKLLFSYSKFNSQISRAILKSKNINSVNMFVIKSLIKDTPILIKSLIFLIVIIIMTLLVRDFDFSAYKLNIINNSFNSGSIKVAKNPMSFSDFFNCIWCLMMTVTSVGYGDNYPISYLGRTFTIITHLIGVVGIGTCILTFSSYLDFTNDEEKVYAQLKKIFDPENNEHKAANVIKTILIMHKYMKNLSDYKNVEINKAKFIFNLKIRTETRIFKDDFLIARTFSIPINDLVKTLENKLYDAFLAISSNIDELSNINSDFKTLEDEQETIIKRMNNINTMQLNLAAYFLKVYNVKFNEKHQIKEKNNNLMLPYNMQSQKFRFTFVNKRKKFLTTNIYPKENKRLNHFSQVIDKSKLRKDIMSKTNIVLSSSSFLNDFKQSKNLSKKNFQKKMTKDAFHNPEMNELFNCVTNKNGSNNLIGKVYSIKKSKKKIPSNPHIGVRTKRKETLDQNDELFSSKILRNQFFECQSISSKTEEEDDD